MPRARNSYPPHVHLINVCEAQALRRNCSINDTAEQNVEVTTSLQFQKYEGWNFNSGNYLFTTDTK